MKDILYNEIPSLDLADFTSGSSDKKQAFVQKLGEAYNNIGFVAIKNHGLDKELQDKLYAQDRWSVLCIFQAMDAAGKDGAIKHVFSGVNPQGCQVHSFKAPGPMELDHDFLWRHSIALPERGLRLSGGLAGQRRSRSACGALSPGYGGGERPLRSW